MAGRLIRTRRARRGRRSRRWPARAYTTERVAASRLRRHDDGDIADELVPAFDEIRSLPSHDGGSINVISRGEGPPIVLSHGVTLSVRTWVKQMESLPAAGFRTIAFDHRGHGASTVGEGGHTLDTLAGDVRSVVEGLDLRDAVLVGHSMGGVAVQLFCLRHPEIAAERVAGIVLLSTLSRTALSGSPRLLRVIERIAASAPDAERGARVREPRAAHLPDRLRAQPAAEPRRADPPDDPRVPAGDPEGCRGSAVRARARRRAAEARGADAGDLRDERRAHAAGRSAPHRGADPRCTARDAPGAGHMAMLEQSETVDRLIIEFAHEVQTGRTARHQPGALSGSITDVAGVQAGNVTLAGTGVTVVLLPEHTIGSCEVRGGAPASRETALLEPTKLVEHVDAVVLTGGSAFGLATADGVMKFLAMRGRGLPVERGSGADRPDRGDLRPGRRRAVCTRRGRRRGRGGRGRVAATGSRPVGSAPGPARRSASGAAARTGCPGGMGTASVRVGDATVGALAVVNAIGDVDRCRRRDRRRVERATGRRRVSRTRRSGRGRTRRSWSSRRTPGARRWSASCWPRAPTTGWPARCSRSRPDSTATSRSGSPPVRSTRTSTGCASAWSRPSRRRSARPSAEHPTQRSRPVGVPRCRALIAPVPWTVSLSLDAPQFSSFDIAAGDRARLHRVRAGRDPDPGGLRGRRPPRGAAVRG